MIDLVAAVAEVGEVNECRVIFSSYEVSLSFQVPIPF